MLSIQQRNYETHTHKQKSVTHTQEKKEEMGTASKVIYVFNLADKHSKATVTNMFKEPKETMSKALKQGLIATSHKVQNKRNYKKNQIEVEKYTLQIKKFTTEA